AAAGAEVWGIDARGRRRIALGGVTLRRPMVSLERDANGVVAVPTRDKPAADKPTADTPTREEPTANEQSTESSGPPPITVRAVVIDDGALDWGDAAVKPAPRLEVRPIKLAVAGGGRT